MRIAPTIGQIETFLRVIETGSFTRAAAASGVAQSTLSRTIAALESAIDLKLFHRDTRKVELTEAGRQFGPQAARLLTEFESALAELADLANGRHGHLTVACLPSIAAVILPGALARFRLERPGIEVSLRDGLSQSVLDVVSDGEADFGLTVRPTPHALLSYRHLLGDAFCLVCRADDALAGDGPLAWSVFGARPFVAMSPASSVRAMTDAAFLQAGLSPRPLFECAQLATVVGLVGAGLGVSALPTLAWPILAHAGLHARPLCEPVLSRSIGVVTRSGRPLSAAAAALLAALTTELHVGALP